MPSAFSTSIPSTATPDSITLKRQRLEDVRVHRRQLAQRAPLDLVPLVSHDLRQRLIHALVPEVAVEQAEAGRRVLEEGVERGAMGLAALGVRSSRSRIARGHHGGRAASEPPPRIERLERRRRPSERGPSAIAQRRDRDAGCLADRLPLRLKKKRDVDDEAEVERRVERAGRLERRSARRDQRARERRTAG